MFSGWYGPRNRKLTIEECVRIRVGQFSGLIGGAEGGFALWLGPRQVEIQFCIEPGKRTLFLKDWDDENSILDMVVNLDQTNTRFGGKRSWFRCGCEKRVADLYLKPRTNEFRCRHCSQLTYRSSQQAHSLERDNENVTSMQNWLSNQAEHLNK